MKKLKKAKKCMFMLFLVLSLCMALPSTLPQSMAVQNVKAASLKLNRNKIALTSGQSYNLKVMGTKKKVKWSSSKKSVVTVNGNGKVTAKGKGSAVITARVGKQKLICKVTVKRALISASATSCKFTNTKRKAIKVTYNGDDSIYFENSNNSVVTCNWSKKWSGNTTTLYVTPKNNGTAKIKIYDDSKKKTVTINVTVNASALKKDLLTELKEGLKVELIVPSVGSSQNYYCQVKFTNHTGHEISLTSTVYANGKACSNSSAMNDIVEDGYYEVASFRRGYFYPYKEDMYLDNQSKAWTMIKVNGTGFAVKFDVNGNTEIGQRPQDIGIY